MSFSQAGKILWLLLFLSVLMFTPACGQKGDLYHPGEKQSSLSIPRLPA